MKRQIIKDGKFGYEIVGHNVDEKIMQLDRRIIRGNDFLGDIAFMDDDTIGLDDYGMHTETPFLMGVLSALKIERRLSSQFEDDHRRAIGFRIVRNRL